jgi:hypothetical protein
MRLRGKKIGTLHVPGPSVTESLELRLEHGHFLIRYLGTYYSAETQNELLKIMKEVLKESQKISYTRYLILDLEAYDSGGFYYSGNSKEESDIEGFRLRYKIADISNQDIGGYRMVQYYCSETSSGKLIESGTLQRLNWPIVDQTVIEFTPERHARLRAMRAAISDLVKALSEIVTDDKAVMRLLDTKGARLLPAMTDKRRT